MVALREAELETFLKKRASALNGLLFYGNEDSAVGAAVRLVSRHMAGGEEPLRMDASSLRSDSAGLDDAFRAMSLLGDRRLIVLTGVDENTLDRIQPVLQTEVLCNFVVLIAGVLKAGSKLRNAVESTRLFAAVGFYEESDATLVSRVEALFRSHKLTAEPGCAERFVELLGSDRSLYPSEIEKLSLYVGADTPLSLQLIEDVCGDQAEFGSDRLIDVMLDGDIHAVDRYFASMVETGEAKSVLIMLQMHLSRLQHVSAAVSRGSDLASAFRSAKPPVFQKQQSAVARQVKTFTGDDLEQMQTSVQRAMLQSRQMADLNDAIIGRCLLSLARSARQSRTRL
jgi:DNA polymerase III subunit delta